MKPLFDAEGRAALDVLMDHEPLLAFDFDGTLAPIVERPDDARVPPRLVPLLRRLARRWPVAVVTGRSLDDLRHRLDFEPRYVVGNHGAEDPAVPPPTIDPAPMQRLRETLAAHADALRAAQVVAEDKGLSFALHYRRAADKVAALRCIDELLAGAAGGLKRFGGKQVVNVVLEAAPDKADAVDVLMHHSRAHAALFVGDDVTDEFVFERAPPDWLTVRVGDDDHPTKARFGLASTDEMGRLLEALLGYPGPAGLHR
jgi:trehalose 6-phosphate phosphatase